MSQMYDNETLKEMAEEAKKKLSEKGELVENIRIDSDVDLYGEYIDEAYDDIEQSNNYEVEEFDPSLSPNVNYDIKDSSNYEIDMSELEKQPEELPLYDDLLFPGGPTVGQVEIWKKSWEGYKIYVLEILEEMFVFRTLDRYEYKQICAQKNLDALLREELICKTVTLWPPKYDFNSMAKGMAGLPSTYSQAIMERSGFTNQIAIQVI